MWAGDGRVARLCVRVAAWSSQVWRVAVPPKFVQLHAWQSEDLTEGGSWQACGSLASPVEDAKLTEVASWVGRMHRVELSAAESWRRLWKSFGVYMPKLGLMRSKSLMDGGSVCQC